jgi:hypothetical protein
VGDFPDECTLLRLASRFAASLPVISKFHKRISLFLECCERSCRAALITELCRPCFDVATLVPTAASTCDATDADHAASCGSPDGIPIVLTGFRALIAVAQGFEACGTDHCGFAPTQLSASVWSSIVGCITSALCNRKIRHVISSLSSFSVGVGEQRACLDELLMCDKSGVLPSPHSVHVGLLCIALGYWIHDSALHHAICGGSPPSKHKRGSLLESGVPLSESVLWKQQLPFYARKDNIAWTPGAVRVP